jgi:hypothetical protein
MIWRTLYVIGLTLGLIADHVVYLYQCRRPNITTVLWHAAVTKPNLIPVNAGV